MQFYSRAISCELSYPQLVILMVSLNLDAEPDVSLLAFLRNHWYICGRTRARSVDECWWWIMTDHHMIPADSCKFNISQEWATFLLSWKRPKATVAELGALSHRNKSSSTLSWQKTRKPKIYENLTSKASPNLAVSFSIHFLFRRGFWRMLCASSVTRLQGPPLKMKCDLVELRWMVISNYFKVKLAKICCKIREATYEDRNVIGHIVLNAIMPSAVE